MFLHLSRIFHSLAVLSWLFQPSYTQLTGYIKNLGNPYIVTLQVSNPTEDMISVLRWNNIFDNATQLPVAFTVKDYQGAEVQIASTYAMRAGVSNSDLYSLEPGQNFTKTLDVRQFLQSLPSGPTGSQPKMISLSFPSSFKGVSGTVSIAPEAAASLDSHPPTLGDFASSGLTDITLTANTLQLSLQFPMYQNLDPSFTAADDGIQLNSDCKAQNATDMLNALFDAGIYARAVKLATDGWSNELYTRFFSNQSRQNVSSIAGAAARNIHGASPHVDLYCSDIGDICGDPNILGYTFTPSYLGNAYIGLCPSARALGRAPEPCSALQPRAQISASSSHVLFHLLFTLNNVVKSVISNSVYGSLACSQLVNSTSDPTKNADSFAQLAIAQWAYGLGGAPYDGPSCLPAIGVMPDNQKRAADSINAATPRPITAAADIALSRRLVSYDSRVIGRCTGAEMDMLQIAGANARFLATYALNEINGHSNDLWTTFFNGDSVVKAQVAKAFEAISVWNTTDTPFPVRFKCDSQRDTIFCQNPSGSIVRTNPIAGVIIVCPQFFYYPIALECLSPSATSYTEPDDQGGILLKELLSIKTVANPNMLIADGDPLCSEWNCIVQNAHDRVLPGFKQENLPENVGSNYEYFAYAARAGRMDCSWMEFAGDLYGGGLVGGLFKGSG